MGRGRDFEIPKSEDKLGDMLCYCKMSQNIKLSILLIQGKAICLFNINRIGKKFFSYKKFLKFLYFFGFLRIDPYIYFDIMKVAFSFLAPAM